MQINKIDGVLFKTMVVNGAENLKQKYQNIDALNVFPVPDGDTGTNMKMTIEGGVSEIYNLDELDVYEDLKNYLVNVDGQEKVVLSSQLFRELGFRRLQTSNALQLAQA